MKDTVKIILEHPVASFFILDVTLCGIAKIIWALRKPCSETTIEFIEQKD